MSAVVLSGIDIAKKREPFIKSGIEYVFSNRGKPPRLDVIVCSDSDATAAYVSSKKKKGEELGIDVQIHMMGTKVSNGQIISLIDSLNRNPLADGIIVQLPLPSTLDSASIISLIDAKKDVDGLSPFNVGKLWKAEDPYFLPCTPQGIVDLLSATDLSLEGKRAVIIGRSNIVGKPLAALLLQRDLTVTICHSKTRELPRLTSSADVLIAAIGVAHFVKKEMVKPGAIVIDVGITRLSGRLVGDVHFDEVKEVAGFITPVPGGVGPLTVSHLLENVVIAARRNLTTS